ncbi:MlaA family lipoprotein, partial [Pseudomonadota bacterium]
MAVVEWKTMNGLMRGLRVAVLRFALLFFAGLTITACASAPAGSDPEALAEYREINDPIEPFNRVMFEFNRGLDTLVLRPVATMYRAFIPPPVRCRGRSPGRA